MKVLFINSVIDYGSTGRIVRDLSEINGIIPKICYGRKRTAQKQNTYKITDFCGNFLAATNTILFNKNGLSNKKETLQLLRTIDEFKPDIVHIHNLHGYYINYQILFEYLNLNGIKTIWTFHDCWPFTGYCMHFDYLGCRKFVDGCNSCCPAGFSYPFSIFKQNIDKTYELKRSLFSHSNMLIVTPSEWMKKNVLNSFLSEKEIFVINNGIDLGCFKPVCKKNDKFTIILVASIWTKQKGIYELEKLVELIEKDINVVIVGSMKRNKRITDRCKIIKRTNSKEELAKLYSSSHLFINLTLEENFPTVNIESLACGTPVLTYNTGGSPEIIDKKTGIIIDKYDINQMAKEINNQYINYTFRTTDCIERSKKYSKEIMLKKYSDLYKKVLEYESVLDS